MPDDKVAVTVKSVTLTKETGTERYFASLQDEVQRELKIYIGQCEGQALAAGLQGYAFDRPGTYDAMLSVITAAGAVVEEVCISDIRNETFYALVSVRVGDQVQPVDIRPSDALNIAVRTGCPLFVSEKVFLALLDAERSVATRAAETITVTVTRATEIVAMSAADVSDELARLFAEDQSDRTTQPIDWDAVRPRDAARLGRVKQLYHGRAIRSGENYFHAALILQHSGSADDHLLAHEFCVVAISQGIENSQEAELAKWLAAASEDRFLQNIGRLQRFGTQYQQQADGSYTLGETDPAVEDCLRRALGVPSLLQAEAGAKQMSKPK